MSVPSAFFPATFTSRLWLLADATTLNFEPPTIVRLLMFTTCAGLTCATTCSLTPPLSLTLGSESGLPPPSTRIVPEGIVASSALVLHVGAVRPSAVHAPPVPEMSARVVGGKGFGAGGAG